MTYDYLIIGAGIIGQSLALALRQKYANASIAIIEKEEDVGYHSSGRNSGVLHAGFYYTKDSLKAKFTKQGNRALQDFCDEYNLKINRCGKVVIAQNEEELKGLEELKKRGDANGVLLQWLDEDGLKQKSPEAKTYKKALFSPTTATVNPKEILKTLSHLLQTRGTEFFFDTAYIKKGDNNSILTNQGKFRYKYLINSAGLYADKIAKDYGVGKNYVIIPFKGIYLKDEKNISNLSTNIYPVPNLANPFLGVHYTLTIDNEAKIGPTAIPAFWRENYKGFANFNLNEMAEILFYEAKLFLTNAFGFRSLAISELKKYNKSHFLNLALNLTNSLDKSGYTSWSKPGIRAQLLDTNTLELVQDFVVKQDKNTTHILNAVSPAFTCSMSFAKWVVKKYL